MPLVSNALGGDHRHKHLQTQALTDAQIKASSRNQACVGLRPPFAWFKNNWFLYDIKLANLYINNGNHFS